MTSFAQGNPTLSSTHDQRKTTKNRKMSFQRGTYATDSVGECDVSKKKSRTSPESTERGLNAIKSPCDYPRKTENVFTKDQTDTIFSDFRTFVLDGLTITNCIFRRDHVEFCYLFQSSSVHNQDELRQQLADHLKIDSKTIKLTKLRAKPIYKETTLRPGETATLPAQSSCKIGAFVEVEGQGNHALMCGHGKTEGDVLLYPNGDPLGIVNISLYPLRQPPPMNCYPDVALAKLEQQNRYIAQVSNGVHGQLRLMQEPVEAVDNMEVRCFIANGNRGVVDSTGYSHRNEELKIDWRMISVMNEADGPVHEEGDSGLLIVDDTPIEGRVRAVGMLVGIGELPLDDEEESTRRTSLAIPLTASFQDLQKDPYCNGGAITFLN